MQAGQGLQTFDLLYGQLHCTKQELGSISEMIDINSRDIAVDTLSFKYFEARHTFMSADSTHAEVEKRIRAKRDVCDFDEFVDRIQTNKIRVTVPNVTSSRTSKATITALAEEEVLLVICRHVNKKKKKSLKIADHLPRVAKRAELPSWGFGRRCEPPNFF